MMRSPQSILARRLRSLWVVVVSSVLSPAVVSMAGRCQVRLRVVPGKIAMSLP